MQIRPIYRITIPAPGEEAPAVLSIYHFTPSEAMEFAAYAQTVGGAGKMTHDQFGKLFDLIVPNVVSWEGVVDVKGVPVPCTPEMVRLFLEANDGMSATLVRELLQTVRGEGDRKNASGGGSDSSPLTPESSAEKVTPMEASAPTISAADAGAAVG